MNRPTLSSSRIGPLLLALFLTEGIIGKTSFAGVRMPANLHVVLTAGLALLFFLAHFFTSKSKSDISISNPILQRARVAVVFLIIGGGFSCVFRVHLFVNLSFWIIWASNFVAIWWSLPFLVKARKADELLEYLLKINAFFMFLMVPLLPVLPYVQGRLGGIFDEPTAMGRFSCLTSILCVVHFFSIKSTGRKIVFLFLASVTFLILSRTRASILAFSLALTFIAFFSLWSKDRWARNRAHYWLFFLIVFLLFLWPSGVFEDDVLTPILAHFRIKRDLGEAYSSARGMNWEQAFRDMGSYGLFGQGFLVKFGVSDFMVGNAPPRYNWLNANDPLNMVLTLAKQAGWFTATAFICLLLILLDGIRRITDPTARLSVMGFMIAGLVLGLIDGNWLITFGEPNDRISMVVLALMVSHHK